MDLKRRDLFTAGAAALGASLLPGCAVPQDPAGTDYPAGDFIVRRLRGGLQVLHARGGDRVIWATAPGGDFIGAEVATAAIKEVGAPQGTFEIADTVQATYERPTIDSVSANAARIVVDRQAERGERQRQLHPDVRSRVDNASSVLDRRRRSKGQPDSPGRRVRQGRSDFRLRITAHLLRPEGQAAADARPGAWHRAWAVR